MKLSWRGGLGRRPVHSLLVTMLVTSHATETRASPPAIVRVVLALAILVGVDHRAPSPDRVRALLPVPPRTAVTVRIHIAHIAAGRAHIMAASQSGSSEMSRPQ